MSRITPKLVEMYTSQLQVLVRVIGANLAIKLLNDAIAKEKEIHD